MRWSLGHMQIALCPTGYCYASKSSDVILAHTDVICNCEALDIYTGLSVLDTLVNFSVGYPSYADFMLCNQISKSCLIYTHFSILRYF